MNYTENFQGIRVDVQAVDITIPDDLQQSIRDMIVKLQRYVREINWVDAYFNIEEGNSTNQKNFSMRVGVPGPDVFAADSGDEWLPLMRSVEEKLRRQMEKSKNS
ncbi:HPF/RaiA family ribosome-associated protein [Aridibaculum aurantiacum]|uniref:HPF/RaiA family ribosome-associated protein n=1 Tax=Aridibaculum aurantiacum TaxID=2810307 RepID=UPI001A96A8A6|nr:HPF/RaiA family ribosome-associated protein [Aridibaculum aurantiacum]